MNEPNVKASGKKGSRNQHKFAENTTIQKNNGDIERSVAAQERDDPTASFVTIFKSHHRQCASLAERFAADDSDAQSYGAISYLCRATQELLEQAKAARTLTEIYLTLDDKHREAVREIMIERFKELSNSARASWLRFCDSIQFVRTERPEVETARQEFEPHARMFAETLLKFIALAAGKS